MVKVNEPPKVSCVIFVVEPVEVLPVLLINLNAWLGRVFDKQFEVLIKIDHDVSYLCCPSIAMRRRRPLKNLNHGLVT